MQTFFIEIVNNPHPDYIPGSTYLGAIVSAKNLEVAKEKALNHYSVVKHEGGRFVIQCAWKYSIPTRELIDKRWRKYLSSTCLMSDKDNEGNTIRVKSYQPWKSKKDVMEDWDRGNISWDDVFYVPSRGGYSVTVQGYMQMPCEIAFFKGKKEETYQKAKQFVKDNTFKGDYYTKSNIKA